MTLKEAIKKAKKIVTHIEVTYGKSHLAEISKEDALIACKDHLDKKIDSLMDPSWYDDDGYVVIADAVFNLKKEIISLHIGS